MFSFFLNLCIVRNNKNIIEELDEARNNAIVFLLFYLFPSVFSIQPFKYYVCMFASRTFLKMAIEGNEAK